MKPFFHQVLSIAAITGIAQSACNYGTSSFPREPSVPVSKFSYVGLTGPLNWYGLNETANSLCDKGTSCKINIPNYPTGAIFENLGTNVEVVVNGTLTDGGKTYKLAQFHFHTPSEHRIDEEYFAMEMHFVFEDADNKIIVLAFLIDLGPTTPLLASTFSSISAIPSPSNATLTGPLFFAGLEAHLSENSIYRYSGSLTTPPCSEDVAWIISAAPLFVDQETFKSVKRVVRFNARYTQDKLGGVNLLENAAMELGARGRGRV